MCIFAYGITSDFEVFQELVDLHQCKARQRDETSIRHNQALLCSLQKHNLELSKFMAIIPDSTPSVISSSVLSLQAYA